MNLLRGVFKRFFAALPLSAFLFCLEGCDKEPMSAGEIAGKYSLSSDGRSLLFIDPNGSYRHVFKVPGQPDMVSAGSWEEIPDDHQISLSNFYAFPSEGLSGVLTRPSYYFMGIGRSWGRLWLNLGSQDAPKRLFKTE